MPYILIYGSKYPPISMPALKAALLQANGELIDDVIAKIFTVMVDLIDYTSFNDIKMNSSYHSDIDVDIFGVLCGNETLLREITSEFQAYSMNLSQRVKRMIDCEFICAQYYESYYNDEKHVHYLWNITGCDIHYGVLVQSSTDIGGNDRQFDVYYSESSLMRKDRYFIRIISMEYSSVVNINTHKFTFDDVRTSLSHSNNASKWDLTMSDSQLIAQFKSEILREYPEVKIVSQFGFTYL
jgi:hypothetical protein